MKRLDLFEQFINEGRLSDLVYHYTDAKRAYEILKSDKLCGRYIADDKIQQSKTGPRGFFSISFTRTKYAGVGYPTIFNISPDGNSVRFEFDGRSLSNHGQAYQFDMGISVGLSRGYRDYEDEMEDRLIMNDRCITNVHKHIKSIHILLTNSNDHIRTIKSLADRYSIPVYFYDGNRKNNGWDYMDTRKAIDIDGNGAIIPDNKPLSSKRYSQYLEHISGLYVIMSYNDPIGKKMADDFLKRLATDVDDEYMKRLNELIVKKKKNLLWTTSRGTHPNPVHYISFAITTKPRHDLSADIMDLYISYMKKRGYTSYKDMLIKKGLPVD